MRRTQSLGESPVVDLAHPIPPWQVHPPIALAAEFLAAVQSYLPQPAGDRPTNDGAGKWAAQILWQRGVRSPAAVHAFLDLSQYVPCSAFAFGDEMEWAMARLKQAYMEGEAIAIWGDFDADGVTATSVLWEGLGQFFRQEDTLHYVIPNRFTDSHGLAIAGIEQLAAQGCQLIVTCDTGSTNLPEIERANALGIDVIVTDHHTLPDTRPPVVALINPRALPPEHPLATLSGVAVAYKLIEALYETLPEVPSQPLESLLDLVAIGLIADLVELRGDCRYLAKRGIQQLRQNSRANPPRPGVSKLLELCQRSGDRPTDISFGIGPRINAISRIHGDARFGVELLTSHDVAHCQALALETELANTRRKALQRDVLQQVETRLQEMDLSTTYAIVLADSQWSPGVLGLVAGQIAQTYGRPTILLNTEGAIARGSARSVNRLDLYRLVKGQDALLLSFGGHPFAAGLSLLPENIPLFSEALNRQLRQEQLGLGLMGAAPVEANLQVTVADLGQALFRELSLLEPYGMGNPAPQLLIRNCWFDRAWHKNLKDAQDKTVRYIRTTFEIWDDTGAKFAGVWWGHYKDELPSGRCEAIAELDYNPYKAEHSNDRNGYEIRLIAVRPADPSVAFLGSPAAGRANWIVDWRSPSPPLLDPPPLEMRLCPSRWAEFRPWFRQALQDGRMLAIAYKAPATPPPTDIWRDLVGIAKYLSRTGKAVRRVQLLNKLGIGDRALQLGFQSLAPLGFHISLRDVNGEGHLQIDYTAPTQAEKTGGAIAIPPGDLDPTTTAAVHRFLDAVYEEKFRRHYFATVPLTTIQAMAAFVQDTASENPQDPPSSETVNHDGSSVDAPT